LIFHQLIRCKRFVDSCLGRDLLWRGRIALETGVIRLMRKTVVTMQKLLENRLNGLRGCQVGLSGPVWHFERAWRGVCGVRGNTANPVNLIV
jgi:hypothetical protein